MARPQLIKAMVLVFAIAGTGCETLLGGVDVTTASPPPEQGMGSLQTAPPGLSPIVVPALPLPSSGAVSEQPVISEQPVMEQPVALPLSDAGAPSAPVQRADAGSLPVAADAGAPAPLPRSAVAGVPTPLELVGVVGGGPRLGGCQGGVAVGVRPTANPNEGAFGQRLTFLELLCAAVTVTPGASANITLRREDALSSWSTTDPFLGLPPTEVPDDRVTWIAQSPALCPEAAPVLVGFSGQYDPVAPDDTETDAIRSLVIECAPLVLAENGIDVSAAAGGHLFISQADSFAATGASMYRSSCTGGTAVTQLEIHAGFWLDGFVLGCSALRAARLAGEACTGGGECQSAVCGDGVCAP